MRSILTLAALIATTPAAAQVGPALDPGTMVGWAGGEAVRQDAECRARKAKGLTCQTRQSDYEKWRNRPGKRDCGPYNWKCPAKPRNP